MTLARFLGVIARRWYLLLAGLLATAGICYAAVLLVPPSYSAKALVLMLPSPEVVGEGGNPLLSLTGLEQPANLVVAQLSSTAAREQVAALAPQADYTMTMDDSTRGPVIAFEVTDSNPSVALEAQRYLASQIVKTLVDLQRQVEAPPASVVTSMPLVMDEVAQRNDTPTLRAAIAAAGTGFALTMLGTFALDGFALRHRETRARRASGTSEAETHPQEPPSSSSQSAGGDGAGITTIDDAPPPTTSASAASSNLPSS